ncbi:MAG: hypothetical protein AAF846_02800 [Chloroflexota bacterium]
MQHTIAYLHRQLTRRSGAANPNTIYRLGKLAHPDATTILLDLLNDPSISDEVRQYILVALRYTDDPRANQTLLQYFHNGYETSTVVINSLGILREGDAVDLMRALLSGRKKTSLNHQDALSLRFRLVIALGNIGDACALPELINCLDDSTSVLKYALSDVQLQVPLCEYAHDAVRQIGTVEAQQIADDWQAKHDAKLQEEAYRLSQQVQANENFVDLEGDLIRLKHYAIIVLVAMNKDQRRRYPNITFDVLKAFARQEGRLTDEAGQTIRDFIIHAAENRYTHLSLEHAFILLDHYYDERAEQLALNIFAHPDYHLDLHGDPLGLLTRKRVLATVPIIAEKITEEGISERYLSSLGMIGGEQAEAIVTEYLDVDDGLISVNALYALADIARESDTALERLSQMIDQGDYSMRQQAIIRMDKVGSRAIFILLSLLPNYDKWSVSKALSTLARIGDVRIIPKLLQLLVDPNQAHIHRDIVNTLIRLEDETAYEIAYLWRQQL